MTSTVAPYRLPEVWALAGGQWRDASEVGVEGAEGGGVHPLVEKSTGVGSFKSNQLTKEDLHP